jgi:cytoskeletal protein RodZ
MSIEEIQNIGEAIKTRRKELNISLKEVETATSIRMNYLQAIEEGDMQKLISPVYAQGFIKQYASFLGLDGEALLKEHNNLFRRADTQDFAYGIGTLEMRGNPGSKNKLLPQALWLSAFFLLLAAAYFTAHYFKLI